MIYATAIDYDVTAQATKRFFATVQNKLHWAIHAETAAEVIYNRADNDKRHCFCVLTKAWCILEVAGSVCIVGQHLTKKENGYVQKLVFGLGRSLFYSNCSACR